MLSIIGVVKGYVIDYIIIGSFIKKIYKQHFQKVDNSDNLKNKSIKI